MKQLNKNKVIKMGLTREELNEELKKVDEDIEKLSNNLIKALQEIGIEYIDLYTYIDQLNKLSTRKNKIQYLLAVDIE